jgi:hypothetical protein
MFKNLGSDNDTEAGHTRNGRVFKEVHLTNLFKNNYGEEGFYIGEELDLTDEEHSKPIREKEGKVEEPCQDETKTSGTVQTTEVSIIISLDDSVALSN